MTDATVEKEEAPITASSMLSAARQAAGLSQDEVAEQLYLTPSFIRYIDGDEIDKLPKKAFIKGYLRSYAKLVNLDGDEVVQQYEQGDIGGSSHSIEIRRVTDQRVGSINFTGPVFQTGVGGLIALIVVVAMVWWFSSSNEKPTVTVSEYKPVEEEPAAATPFQLPERTSLEITASDQPDASDPDLADISLIEETEIEPATEVETAPESSSDEQSLPEPEADDIAAQESTAQESTALESTALEDNILESEAVDEDGSEDSSDDQSVINDLTPLEPGKPILIEREVFSRSLTISAVSGEETVTTSSTICSYNNAPSWVQAAVIPPITFGVLAMVYFSFPGSIRSGEKHK